MKKSCILNYTIKADLCYQNNDKKKGWTYVGLSPTTTKIKTMSDDACCKAASTTGSAKEQKINTVISQSFCTFPLKTWKTHAHT